MLKPNARNTLLFGSLAAMLALPMSSMSQELVSPAPLTTPGAESTGFGSEGFHTVRFTVKADGSVENPSVVSPYTPQFTANRLLGTVSNWKFTPGTEDGQPVDFFNQEFVLVERLSSEPSEGAPGPGQRPGQRPGAGGPQQGMPPAPPPAELSMSPPVQEALVNISEMLTAGDFEKALRNVDKILTDSIVTIFDFAYIHDLKSVIHTELNEPLEALEAIKLATMHRTSSTGETEFFLTPSILETSLRRRFVLAASLSQHAEAIRAYELLNSEFDLSQNDLIRQQAEKIQAVIDGPDPLAMAAGIVKREWTYELTRNIFAIVNVDGRITRLNVRCERRELIELKFEEGVDWTIPDTFGKCYVDVGARTGTTFNLYEFAE